MLLVELVVRYHKIQAVHICINRLLVLTTVVLCFSLLVVGQVRSLARLRLFGSVEHESNQAASLDDDLLFVYPVALRQPSVAEISVIIVE